MALSYTPEMRLARTCLAAMTLACSVRGGFAASGCKEALAQLAVCETANVAAAGAKKSRKREAVSVMQDVATGALVVFAASQPSALDVSTLVIAALVIQGFPRGLLVG
jgi:hypothetical protein